MSSLVHPIKPSFALIIVSLLHFSVPLNLSNHGKHPEGDLGIGLKLRKVPPPCPQKFVRIGCINPIAILAPLVLLELRQPMIMSYLICNPKEKYFTCVDVLIVIWSKIIK